MRKALAIAAPLRVSGLLWPLLAAETGLATWAVLNESIAAVVLGALQLFLRF